MKLAKDKGSLYLITDSTGLSDDEFLSRIEGALKGGVSLVQIREKDRPVRSLIELAAKVHDLTKKYNIPLIVDDRIDVAMAVNTEGVHLGQSDMPVSIARDILGNGKIIGATTKTVAQALEAQNQGADYLGVGAIYPTTTKVKTVLTSVETLTDISNSVNIPVFAIGGLNKDNISILKGVSLAGICVVSAIMKSEDTYLAAGELCKAIDRLGER